MTASKRYGYARVSTREQHLDRQLAALAAAGIAERDIITDKISGKTFARPGWETLTGTLLRPGDTLVIKELDRMGRNWDQIKTEWQRLLDMGVAIEVIDQPMINTGGKSDLEKRLIASVVFELLAYTAQKERDKIRTRQAEGIAAARAAGRPLGSVARALPDGYMPILRAWCAGQKTANQAAMELGISRSTLYRVARRPEIMEGIQQ